MTSPTIDIEALKAVAEKATPGPWELDRYVVHGKDYGLRGLALTPTEPTEDDDGKRGLLRTGSGGALSWTEHVAVPSGSDADDDNFEFIAAANPAVVLALIARTEAAEGAAREHFAAAQHNAKACSELRDLAGQQKQRADNYLQILKSICEFAHQGDCERIVLWVNDAIPGYIETAEQTLGHWIDRANAAETRIAELVAQRVAMEAALVVWERDYEQEFALRLAGKNREAELIAQRDGLVEAAEVLVAEAKTFIPFNLNVDNPNVSANMLVPIDVMMGEFRSLAEAIKRIDAALSTIKTGGVS